MSQSQVVRIGFVGVNTWHAEALSDVILGIGPSGHLPAVAGAEVVAVWGEPALERARLATKTGAREFSADPSELVDYIDLAFILDDTGGGARHRELGEPFLRAGIPVFIDKPMALSLADARALFELAEAYQVPIMSASALRFSAELSEHALDLAAIGEIRAVNVLGPGEWYYYGVHAAELLLTILQAKPEWVSRHVSNDHDVAVVGFTDGRLATVDVLREAYYTFTACAYGKSGWVSLEIDRNYEFYRGLILAAVDMARTGLSPVSADQTLDVLGVLQAGISSESLGRVVRIDEL